MQTIEQLEADLATRITLARTQLEVFHANLGRIGQVIGKDASEVYNKLAGYVDSTEQEYHTTTLRNTAVLFKWSHTLDEVLTVLKEVMASIEAMDSSDVLNVKATVDDIINRASDMTDQIAVSILNYIAPEATPEESGIFKYIMIGAAAYFTLRMLKVSPLLSGIGAVAAAIILGGKSAPVAATPQIEQPTTPAILV
jgi:hypothetical protein